MDSGSGQAVEIAPFHSGGALKGFVVSGRWPDSTKEWAQLLMVAVRVASLPGLLATTTIFGAREELPEHPQPGTVGLVLAEGPVVGESAVPPGYFADHQPPALLMLHRMSLAVAVETHSRPLFAEDQADDANGARERYEGLDRDILVCRITGAFFFGAAASVGAAFDRIGAQPKAVIVDFAAVPILDSTAAATIEPPTAKISMSAI